MKFQIEDAVGFHSHHPEHRDLAFIEEVEAE
jgi:hypothetical protein